LFLNGSVYADKLTKRLSRWYTNAGGIQGVQSIQGWRSYVIVASVGLSFVPSVSRITHECVVRQGWPSRSDYFFMLIRTWM